MEGVGGERELSISIKNWPGKDDELVEFYDARDQFLGVGNYDFKTHFPYDCHSVNLAIRRFRKCRSQPEAVLLSSIFKKPAVLEDKMVISMLLNFGDDSRTLCYASILQIRLSDRQTCDIEIEKIRSLAKKGYALAQALTAQCMKNTQEEYEWALLAAKQRDRLGLFILGDCLEKGKGCVKNTIRAIEMYKESAQLGFDAAMWRFGRLVYGKNDLARYMWQGRAIFRGFDIFDENKSYRKSFVDEIFSFERSFGSLLTLLNSDSIVATEASVIFALGKILTFTNNLHIYKSKFRFVGKLVVEDGVQVVTCFARLIEFYTSWSKQAQEEVKAWLIVGRRLCLYKDIVLLIARFVWAARINGLQPKMVQQPPLKKPRL